MATYCLASTGSDGAQGSPDSPWASIDRLNAALLSGTVGPGDTVLFRRGDTFYGRVEQPGHADQNVAWTTFGAYGPGPKPGITTYKVASDPAGWVHQGGNVWRIDLSANSGAYTGNTSSDKADAGFLKVDGVIHGVKRTSQAALTAQWDFYSSDPYTYVYSTDNPATGRTIEIAPYGPWTPTGGVGDVFTAMPKTIIRDLDIHGCGGTGITNSSYWTPHHVRIENCDIHEIGGSWVPGFTNVRGGNGIQAWIGCQDWEITRNQVWDCYDAGISYQGAQGVQIPANTSFVDLHAHHNRIWDCCQSFETWNEGTDGAGHVNCSFVDNLCFDAGSSWGQAVRPDPAGRGCHLLFYQHQLPADVLIERNVFFGAATNYVFALDGIPDGVVLRNNAVYLALGTLIQTSTIPAGQRPETIEQAAAWVAATGHDQGTVWFDDEAAAQEYLAGLTSRGGKIISTVNGLRVIPRDAAWPTDPAGFGLAPFGTSPFGG